MKLKPNGDVSDPQISCCVEAQYYHTPVNEQGKSLGRVILCNKTQYQNIQSATASHSLWSSKFIY